MYVIYIYLYRYILVYRNPVKRVGEKRKRVLFNRCVMSLVRKIKNEDEDDDDDDEEEEEEEEDGFVEKQKEIAHHQT